MSAPVVSVIMPAYNAGKFIQESIETVIRQTYTDWELLVVDDGSTDNTKTIIDRFCEKDKRIKYYYQQNGKQGKARNLGLKYARGNYIAFLDADDIWLPGKLELQLAEIKENDAALVFSDAYMFSEKDPDKIMNAGKGLFSGKNGIAAFLEMNRIPILTVLMKGEVLREVHGFSENLYIQNAEDYHLWVKLLMRGYVFFGSERALAKYRLHSTSSSSDDKLAVACVVEAFEDLKKENIQYVNLINRYQKKWFNRYHYSTNHWNHQDYKELIKKNCNYLKKAYLIFLFNAMHFCTGITVTRKIMAKLVNY